MKIILSIILMFLSAQSFADTKLDLALYCELKHFSFCNPKEKELDCYTRGNQPAEIRGDIHYHKGTVVIKNTESGVVINSELISLADNVRYFKLTGWEASVSSYIFRGRMALNTNPNKTADNYSYFTINRYTGELHYRVDYANTEDSPYYFTYTYNCKKIEKKF
jgi:hypothetical protein